MCEEGRRRGGREGVDRARGYRSRPVASPHRRTIANCALGNIHLRAVQLPTKRTFVVQGRIEEPRLRVRVRGRVGRQNARAPARAAPATRVCEEYVSISDCGKSLFRQEVLPQVESILLALERRPARADEPFCALQLAPFCSRHSTMPHKCMKHPVPRKNTGGKVGVSWMFDLGAEEREASLGTKPNSEIGTKFMVSASPSVLHRPSLSTFLPFCLMPPSPSSPRSLVLLGHLPSCPSSRPSFPSSGDSKLFSLPFHRRKVVFLFLVTVPC